MREVGGHVSIAGSLSNSIDNTLKIGGNILQIFAGSPRLWARKIFSQDQVEEFLSKKEKNNIGKVFIHALYLVNLASDKSELIDKSINSLIFDLQNGDLIKSEGVVVHIGSHQGRGFDIVKDQLVDHITTVLSKTKNTKFLLENDAGQNGKIGSPEELVWLLNKVKDPRLGICLDTAHLFASGLNLQDKNQIDIFVNYLRENSILDKVKLIHLNDSASDLGSGRDIHADLGKGKIGLQGLSNFINHPSLKHLPLILETPGPDRQGPDKENINIAKSL